jgi:hypothetical protein
MWKLILKATIIAGIMDISVACINAYISSKVTPTVLLKYVASGAFGASAFDGGYNMMAMGLLFHFIIVFACTTIYFMSYPYLSFLKKNIFINSILIAAIAWIVTTLIIVPNSKINPPSLIFLKQLKLFTILIFCIGFPISYFAQKYYSSKNKKV